MEGEFEIELSDLTEDAVRRLLKDAVRQHAVNSMPVGKRGKARQVMDECECCGKPDCDCECDEEDGNAANVEMNRRGVKANLPTVTSEDLPRGMKMAKYKGRKNGKGS